jgi:hypothetical protein
VRDRNGSASGPAPCWLDDDDEDDDDDDDDDGGGGGGGGGVLFTELRRTDTKSHFNCSRVWKVPTSK